MDVSFMSKPRIIRNNIGYGERITFGRGNGDHYVPHGIGIPYEYIRKNGDGLDGDYEYNFVFSKPILKENS